MTERTVPVDIEKKELYKQKIMDCWEEHSGGSTINPKFCKTCIFPHGDPSFTDLPEKAYCMVYTNENGVTKPKSVYFEGARCEYYSNNKDAE